MAHGKDAEAGSVRKAVAELTNQESAQALAEIVMGYARTHYEVRGWDHVVECYSLSELAESIQTLIDMDCANIPMANGADAIKWWDGICDAAYEQCRAVATAWNW